MSGIATSLFTSVTSHVKAVYGCHHGWCCEFDESKCTKAVCFQLFGQVYLHGLTQSCTRSFCSFEQLSDAKV